MLKIHLRGSKSVSGGLLGGVGEVDHDAEAVHLLNHRLQSKVIIIFTVTIYHHHQQHLLHHDHQQLQHHHHHDTHLAKGCESIVLRDCSWPVGVAAVRPEKNKLHDVSMMIMVIVMMMVIMREIIIITGWQPFDKRKNGRKNFR